ncbi:MAG TPA: OmpA family protein [Bacteroidia bacterium]|nr:OmpA family protein [Bacteroidia bacterium]
MKETLLFIFICFLAVACKAQPPALHTKSKKAEKYYTQAKAFLDAFDYPNALKQLSSAIKEDPEFLEAHLLQGHAYKDLDNFESAVNSYKQAFAINPNAVPAAYYFDCADAEIRLGRYTDAKLDYKNYISKRRSNSSPIMLAEAERGIANCDFAINAMLHPVSFSPVSIGGSINSDSCEYFPNITADNQVFLFNRNQRLVDPKTGLLMMTQEDFFISYRDKNGNWSTARNLGPPVNTQVNEGAPSLAPDGRFLFFAACEEYGNYGQGRMGYGECDIFYTQKVNGQWSRPINAGAPLNSHGWETQPSWSSDGKTLYFISSRRGGYGYGDIWMATLGEDGKWSTPMNLGDHINTPYDEESVFIHPDNQTLYFASSGHPGMGDKDLFICRRDSAGKWGNPVNLGYPINTYGRESGLIVDASGQLAYFTSTREGGSGCDDIYKFELPEELRPITVTYLKGKAYNKNTLAPVVAHFELIDVSTGQTMISSSSDPGTGEFLVCIPVNKNYALFVNSPGYLFYSDQFRLKEAADPGKPFLKNIPLQPISDTARVELKNVFFPTAKYDLLPESQAELNKMAQWLKANSKVKVEIAGHTDNVGDKKSNQVLSENRAKSVYTYLMQQGIDPARMKFKGYGDTRPKVKNDTPENRQLNRRVEMRITSSK